MPVAPPRVMRLSGWILWLATAAAAVRKVPKVTVSSQVRFVFVAGLEGTGHHAMTDLTKRCGATCVADGGISRNLYTNGDHPKGAFVFGDQTAAQIVAHRNATVAAFRQQAAALGSGPPRLVFLNCKRRTTGQVMMSYPTLGGPDKVLHRPDVRVLAELAEEAGVDLRVVVLQRNALDILMSTTIHRKFGSDTHEASVLADNALALAAQLRAVDSAFFECVDLAARGWLVQDGLVALNTTRDFLERQPGARRSRALAASSSRAWRKEKREERKKILEAREERKKKKEEGKKKKEKASNDEAKKNKASNDEAKMRALHGSPFVDHLAAAILFLDEACVGRDDARFAAPPDGRETESRA